MNRNRHDHPDDGRSPPAAPDDAAAPEEAGRPPDRAHRGIDWHMFRIFDATPRDLTPKGCAIVTALILLVVATVSLVGYWLADHPGWQPEHEGVWLLSIVVGLAVVRYGGVAVVRLIERRGVRIFRGRRAPHTPASEWTENRSDTKSPTGWGYLIMGGIVSTVFGLTAVCGFWLMDQDPENVLVLLLPIPVAVAAAIGLYFLFKSETDRTGFRMFSTGERTLFDMFGALASFAMVGGAIYLVYRFILVF